MELDTGLLSFNLNVGIGNTEPESPIAFFEVRIKVSVVRLPRRFMK